MKIKKIIIIYLCCFYTLTLYSQELQQAFIEKSQSEIVINDVDLAASEKLDELPDAIYSTYIKPFEVLDMLDESGNLSFNITYKSTSFGGGYVLIALHFKFHVLPMCG